MVHAVIKLIARTAKKIEVSDFNKVYSSSDILSNKVKRRPQLGILSRGIWYVKTDDLGYGKTVPTPFRRSRLGRSWLSDPAILRSAYRNRHAPVNRDNDYGLRLARTLLTP